MNAAHLHLLLNHVPVLGATFALLLLAFAVWKRKDESTKVSLVILALVGLASIVVYLTGEPAEELVEDLPGFSEAIMDAHEDAALAATIGASLAGAVALAGLWIYRGRTIPYPVRALALALALVVSALMGWTAYQGGQVVHTEIRAASTGTSGAPDGREREDDEREEDDREERTRAMVDLDMSTGWDPTR